MDAGIIFERPPVRFKRCKHGAMLFFSNDHYVGRSLDLYGEFCEGEYELFAQILRPGMTVVEAGASIGVHTLGLAELVGPTGQVFAFEPQRALYHLLCGNLALNGYSRVSAFQAGLASTARNITVNAAGAGERLTLGGADDAPLPPCELVPTATLDSFGLMQCHFVKIDVDGMELDLLKGATETLVKHHPVLYVANNQRSNSPDLIQWLLDRQYRLYWHLPPLYNPQNYFQDSMNVFAGIVSTNMLCVPTSLGGNIENFQEITSAHDHWTD
jgi:FkbM family methyltransferase